MAQAGDLAGAMARAQALAVVMARAQALARAMAKGAVSERGNMKTRMMYRDGIEEEITGSIKVLTTQDGHTVEVYKLKNGQKRFFVTLSGTHFCAHGDTLEQAITDAIWKDPEKRPSKDALVKEIREAGKERQINLNEFRLLTGACLTGCHIALEKAGLKGTQSLTAHDIKKKVSKEWGDILLGILQWEN